MYRGEPAVAAISAGATAARRRAATPGAEATGERGTPARTAAERQLLSPQAAQVGADAVAHGLVEDPLDRVDAA